MPLFSLSCANCSAPLEIGGDTERFACAYCGSAQILERKGGTVFLKKVENAITAVQRGTDRTAAELAIPRLTRERGEVLEERAAAFKAHKESRTRAGNRSAILNAIVFVPVAFIGLIISAAVFESHIAIKLLYIVVYSASLLALAKFLQRKSKLPPFDSKRVASEYDVRLSQIDEHLRANREILNKLPH